MDIRTAPVESLRQLNDESTAIVVGTVTGAKLQATRDTEELLRKKIELQSNADSGFDPDPQPPADVGPNLPTEPSVRGNPDEIPVMEWVWTVSSIDVDTVVAGPVVAGETIALASAGDGVRCLPQDPIPEVGGRYLFFLTATEYGYAVTGGSVNGRLVVAADGHLSPVVGGEASTANADLRGAPLDEAVARIKALPEKPPPGK